jgi:aerobic carbon-monoxide dehydrogenase small subunit
MKTFINVNKTDFALEIGADVTLLDFLRENLGLTGTKEGCAEGECGACTVLRDGDPIDSCIIAAHACAGTEITTIEGIAESAEKLSAIQKSLIDSGGIQCGFCTPGFIMVLTALLRENKSPSEDDIRLSLAGNICRCTGYEQIVDAAMNLVKSK